MIRKFIHKDEHNWDRWIDPLLFSVREVPQASMGFSPFELLFNRKAADPSPAKNEIQHVLDLRAKLHTLGMFPCLHEAWI